MRTKVIDFYEPEVMAVVETWLKGEEIIDAEGYKWVGCNRRLLHKRAVPTVLWVTCGEEEGVVASHGGHSGRIPRDGRKEEMCSNTR